MEKIVRQSLLYDFYGELLTEHQKKIYEEVVMEDLSYSEIARISNISRQGAYDMVKRCDKLLEGYEEKLHLVQRFLTAKEKLGEIENAAQKLREHNGNLQMDTMTESLIEDILSNARSIQDEF